MSVKALLFDMGNVVIEISFLKMMDALGFQCQTERDAARMVESWAFHDQYERGLLTTDQFRAAVSETLGRELEPGQFEKGWTSIYVGQVMGIEELLSELALSYPIYLLSNTNPAHMAFCVSQFGVLSRFNKRFLSYELGCRKPEREIYERVVRDIGVVHGVKQDEILFFDDMPGNVSGARDFGLRAELADRSVDAIIAGLKRHQMR
jgi:putative hydrolase of the HAD superfamily